MITSKKKPEIYTLASDRTLFILFCIWIGILSLVGLAFQYKTDTDSSIEIWGPIILAVWSVMIHSGWCQIEQHAYIRKVHPQLHEKYVVNDFFRMKIELMRHSFKMPKLYKALKHDKTIAASIRSQRKYWLVVGVASLIMLAPAIIISFL